MKIFHEFRKLFVVAFGLLFATALMQIIMVAGCKMTAIAPPNPKSQITAYLPYITAVDVPEQVKEGEHAEIVLHFSTRLNPDVLKYLRPDTDNAFVLNEGGVITLSTWITKYFTHDYNPVLESASFTLPLLNAGNYLLRITTAESLEWGGFSVTYEGHVISPFQPIEPSPPHSKMLEIPITVLPAEES